MEDGENSDIQCPQCGSKRLYRDGLRYLADGSAVQRWLCRECAYRFTDPKQTRRSLKCQSQTQHVEKIERQILNSRDGLTLYCQGSCEAKSRAPTSMPVLVKTLAEVESQSEKRAAGATETSQAEVKGKILEFLWHLQKQGYSGETVKFYNHVLQLLSRKVNLLDGEAVKEYLAKMTISETTKCNYANALQSFYKYFGVEWQPPRYKPQKAFPFIPTEQELDLLIANTSKTVSAVLQLLKDTGMRLGEALTLKWTDVDFERKIVRITPKKGSLPRVVPISDLTMAMLKRLKVRADGRIFGSRGSLTIAFYKQRRKLAFKLQNPRLMQISFHTFRHWKGTMEYHKTRDILHVQRLLGHKSIQNTLIYVNIENAVFQNMNEEFIVKTASTVEEACKLVEVGFEYVTDMDGVKIFRKRK